MELAKLRVERVELERKGGDGVSGAGKGVSVTEVGAGEAKDGIWGAGVCGGLKM